MGCDPPSGPYMGIQTIHGLLKLKKDEKWKKWGSAFEFFYTIHGLWESPCIKVIPPPTTTTTWVTSRPAGLRPQVKKTCTLKMIQLFWPRKGVYHRKEKKMGRYSFFCHRGRGLVFDPHGVPPCPCVLGPLFALNNRGY